MLGEITTALWFILKGSKHVVNIWFANWIIVSFVKKSLVTNINSSPPSLEINA